MAKNLERWLRQLERLALKVWKALTQHRRHIEHQRQQHQINAQAPFAGTPLKQVQIAGHRGAVLHRGDALGGVEPLGRLKLPQPLVVRRLGHVHKQRNERRFHHQPCGLSAAGPAHDHPTGRVRGAGVITRQGQSAAVEHGAMVRVMDHHHRVLRKQRIEIGLVEVAAIRETIDVVAVGDHPLALAGGMARHMLTQHLLQLGNAGDRARRRPLNVGPAHHLQRIGKVAVGVNEARQQGTARQIDLLGAGPGVGQHRGLVADSDDDPTGNGDRLGPRLGGLHRQDGASVDDQISDVAGH